MNLVISIIYLIIALIVGVTLLLITGFAVITVRANTTMINKLIKLSEEFEENNKEKIQEMRKDTKEAVEKIEKAK